MKIWKKGMNDKNINEFPKYMVIPFFLSSKSFFHFYYCIFIRKLSFVILKGLPLLSVFFVTSHLSTSSSLNNNFFVTNTFNYTFQNPY